MKTSEATWGGFRARGARHKMNGDAVSVASDVLPLFDFLFLLAAASLSTFFFSRWLAPTDAGAGFGAGFEQATLVAAALAPFILYNKSFGPDAARGQMLLLIRSHALRFTLFTGVVLILGGAGHALEQVPSAWLVIWLSMSLLLTSVPRIVAAQIVLRMRRRGVLTDVIAVVGAGPVADRLVRTLRQDRPETIELLGIFDDTFAETAPLAIRPAGNLSQLAETAPVATRPAGNLTQLIELGKTRKIDWILLTLPPTANQRVLSIVKRLKDLSVPIGLCPQHVGLNVPYRTIDYVADSVPVTLLADRPIKRWNAVIKWLEDYLIGGILTLLLLPVLAIVALAIKLDSPGPAIFKQRRHAFNNREFDVYKFRTMHWAPATATDTLKQTSRDDVRFTRLGRFIRSSSLDELPQLFNVMKGEMSLVGPRPHAVNMRTEARLGHEITGLYPHRHRVKPGITGWSQVNGSRGPVDVEEQMRRRVELDLYYIDNWSLLLDLRILFKTLLVVIRRTDAY